MAAAGSTVPKVFVEIFKEFEKKELGPLSNYSLFSLQTEVLDELPADEVVQLCDIQQDMLEGEYNKDYWKFIRDVHIALNILIENHTKVNLLNYLKFKIKISLYLKKSQTYKRAQECLTLFREKMDEFMKSQGYCCGSWYTCVAKDILCSARTKESECTIEDGQTFYRYDSFSYCLEHLQEKFEDRKMIKLSDEM